MKSIRIESAKYIDGHRLMLEFSDGKTQPVDFGHFLESAIHPEIRKYLDAKEFRRFKVENGDLMWGDFDLIFPIMDLYENKLERETETPRRPAKVR
jgi:hypothetical protein